MNRVQADLGDDLIANVVYTWGAEYTKAATSPFCRLLGIQVKGTLLARSLRPLEKTRAFGMALRFKLHRCRGFNKLVSLAR